MQKLFEEEIIHSTQWLKAGPGGTQACDSEYLKAEVGESQVQSRSGIQNKFRLDESIEQDPI